MNELLDHLKDVKKAREDEKEAMRLKKETLASPIVSAVFDDHKQKKAAKDEAEKSLRSYVLGWVKENPDEVWANHGVKFRKTTKLKYSASDALAWCKENFKAALTIDKSKFEKYVKSADKKPEFVEVVETLGVTIPSDLSEL